jgi:glycosyltransferase involved in cell wall biosynthesis
MRVLFALSGLHRIDRGAENAFISIASELAKTGDAVTLIGSGQQRPGAPYRFLRAASLRRQKFEHFPSLPTLRDECAYEELTFVPDLLRRYRPEDYDITITCSYPFTNWVLRRPVLGGSRPAHVFVTQNGDLPAITRKSEFQFFDCDGLVCTNPDFYERNKGRWYSRLIPNGVDCQRFSPGAAERQVFGLPVDRTIVLVVSALVPTKRVEVGIEAVSHLSDAHLVVAGDGPLRKNIDDAAARLLPGRFNRLSITAEKMPLLYRSVDIFLHLAKIESSPLSFFEAMASGLPIVAHDSPQLRWIAGNDEFLVNTESPKAIARQIGLARDTGANGRQKRLIRAETFSWTNIVRQYQEFLREILARRASTETRHGGQSQEQTC